MRLSVTLTHARRSLLSPGRGSLWERREGNQSEFSLKRFPGSFSWLALRSCRPFLKEQVLFLILFFQRTAELHVLPPSRPPRTGVKIGKMLGLARTDRLREQGHIRHPRNVGDPRALSGLCPKSDIVEPQLDMKGDMAERNEGPGDAERQA